MSAEITPLFDVHPIDEKPCEDVIAMLKDVLARAERGAIRAVAIATCENDDERHSSCYTTGNVRLGQLKLAVDNLQIRLTDAWYTAGPIYSKSNDSA